VAAVAEVAVVAVAVVVVAVAEVAVAGSAAAGSAAVGLVAAGSLPASVAWAAPVAAYPGERAGCAESHDLTARPQYGLRQLGLQSITLASWRR
jgi:hypothetical protein